MKEMSYVSLINILISNIESQGYNDGTRKATQEDIDELFG